MGDAVTKAHAHDAKIERKSINAKRYDSEINFPVISKFSLEEALSKIHKLKALYRSPTQFSLFALALAIFDAHRTNWHHVRVSWVSRLGQFRIILDFEYFHIFGSRSRRPKTVKQKHPEQKISYEKLRFNWEWVSLWKGFRINQICVLPDWKARLKQRNSQFSRQTIESCKTY